MKYNIKKYQSGNKITQEQINKGAKDFGTISKINDSWRSKLSRGITNIQERQPEALKVLGGFLPFYGDVGDVAETTKAFSTGDNWDKVIAVAGLTIPFIGGKFLKKFKPNIKEKVESLVDKLGFNKYGKNIDKFGTTVLSEDSPLPRTLSTYRGYVNFNNQIIDSDNRIISSYVNPRNKSKDVYMGGLNDDNNYIAFQRQYGFDGKDLTNKPLNRFSITADMPDASGKDVGKIFSDLAKYLPRHHELAESKTVSIDGLKTWGNQLKHGYIPLVNKTTGKVEFTSPYVSGSSKGFSLKGDVSEGSNKFGTFRFENPEEREQVINEIADIYKKYNLPGGVTKSGSNIIRLDLPILKRTFGIAAPIGVGMGMYRMNQNNK